MIDRTILSLVCTLPGIMSVQAKESKKAPNLLIIMADQWRGQALGFLGEEPVKTPNLDRMATEGVVFNQAVSNYPVSSPARAMLMTGQYPISNKVIGNCNAKNTSFGVELRQEAVCWSDVLKSVGYDLGYIGKWHLDAPVEPHIKANGTWNEWCPPEKRHGFDYWMAYGTYDVHTRPMYWSTDLKREEYFFVNQWGPEYEADRALEFIRNEKQLRDGSKPFALMVSMNPPHTGYELVPERYKKLYQNLDVESVCKKKNIPAANTKNGKYYRNNLRNYYACMTGVDEQVGRIIEGLKKSGMYENTIVVFTSDHGNCLGIHDEISKNIYYEESMRIPMLMTWPGQLSPRQDNQLLISVSDLYPTLLTMMGFEKNIPDEVETNNLARSVLTGKKGVKYQPYFKYVVGDSEDGIGYRGVRTDRYTYVLKLKGDKIVETFLFDRQNDPEQLSNIAGRYKKVEKEMREYLKKALVQAKDRFAEKLDGK